MLALSNAVQAQGPPSPLENIPPRYVLKFTPQHFFQSTAQVGIERFNNDATASHSLFGYLFYAEKPNTMAYGLEYQYRKYLVPQGTAMGKSTNATYGLYAGPYVRGGYNRFYYWSNQIINPTDPNNSLEINNLNERNYNAVFAGLLLGLQIEVHKKLYFDAYIGGGLNRNFGNDQRKRNEWLYATNEPMYWLADRLGALPKMGINVGFRL